MKFRSRLLAVVIAASLMPVAVVAEDDAGKPAKEAATEKAEPKKAEAVAACTGSRIKPARTKDCERISNRPLRSFTAEELQNTGEMNLAAALRQLDPSIR